MQYKWGIGFIILVLALTLNSWSEEQIFSDKPIAQFGKALLAGEIVFSPDGKILAVPEEGGICFYDADNLTEVAILPIDGWVSPIVFSPDGKTLALGIGGRVCLWDTTWEEGITTLGFHDRNIDSIVFSSDGKTLTSACYGEVRSWDIAGKKEIGVLKGIPTGKLSPDGKMLVAVDGVHTIRIRDIGGKEISVLKGHTGWQITTVFSPDGKTLASGSEDRTDKTVRLWDIKEGKAIAVIEGDRVYGFSPDGKTLYLHYVSNEEEGVRLWDVTEGKEIDTWRFYRQSPKLFSTDWKRLILRDWDGTIRLWDVTEKKEIASLEKYYAGRIYSIDFSPDGRMLASGEGKIIRLWDVAEQKEIAVFEGHADWGSVTFSPDGKMLVLNCQFDKTVRLWDIAEKKETIAFKGSNSFAPHFSPDGKIFAVEEGYDPTTTHLWDIEKKKEIDAIKGDHTVFNPDGRLTASCDDKVVRLWDVVEKKEIAALEGHIAKVTYVIFSSDGKMLASIGDDGTARLWNVADKKEIAVFEGEISSLCFSPDGKILAVGSSIKVGVIEEGKDFEGESLYNPVVCLWDIEGRKEVAVFKQDTGTGGLVAEVDEVAFAPDGKTVFLNIHFFEGMVSLILWDIEEKEETVIYDGEELLYHLSPDNKIIALFENNGLHLWNVMEKRGVQSIDLGSYYAPIVFSPDWKKFAAAHDGIIAIWGEKSSQ